MYNKKKCPIARLYIIELVDVSFINVKVSKIQLTSNTLYIVSGISSSETKTPATGGETGDNIDVVVSGKGYFDRHVFIYTQYN